MLPGIAHGDLGVPAPGDAGLAGRQPGGRWAGCCSASRPARSPASPDRARSSRASAPAGSSSGRTVALAGSPDPRHRRRVDRAASRSPSAAWSLFGAANGLTDVGMNVSGAANEQALGKTIMPIFHAFFSFGTMVGAGLGVLAEALRRADLGSRQRHRRGHPRRDRRRHPVRAAASRTRPTTPASTSAAPSARGSASSCTRAPCSSA